MTASATDLAERYGTPSRAHRTLLVILVGLGAGTGLIWLLWVVLFHGSPKVTSQMLGYDVAGQHQVTATWTVVRRDEGVTASCLLRAFADDHSVVGELRVPVPGTSAGGQGTDLRTTVRSTVRTERAATTVEVVGCTAAGQQQPR